MFIGREYELNLMLDFKGRNTAGLMVCRGRRRIGKSTLIQQFGKKFDFFYEFYGLAPREKMTLNDQLRNFSELFAQYFGVNILFNNWTDAFSTLAEFTSKGNVLILLDEISWMGSKDKDFTGKLKGIWDTKFKKNSDLILVLCGSVSSWINKNILNDKGFFGRVSLTITLDELPLYDANQFWRKRKRISPYEKFKLLSITGGVPRYLEEIIPSHSAEQNIKQMCFSKEGFLFTEFDKIFKDIFYNKSDSYKNIVKALVSGCLGSTDLAKKLKVEPTGDFSEKLSILVESGFLARDYVWQPGGKQSSRSKYRLKDNYLRFYLKYIESEKTKIENGLYKEIHLENLKGWESIMGLQIENLVLNNLQNLLKKLNIVPETLLSASPYFQKKNNRAKACQIDLLIDTKYVVYVCEIKYRKKIGISIIEEIEDKINKLKVFNIKSIRPVLIYLGEISKPVIESGYFSYCITIEDFLDK